MSIKQLHSGTDELSSDRLSDIAMLAAGVASSPPSHNEHGWGKHLFQSSNLKRSKHLQQAFKKLRSGPAFMASTPAPSCSPHRNTIQVRPTSSCWPLPVGGLASLGVNHTTALQARVVSAHCLFISRGLSRTQVFGMCRRSSTR
jgi:hypothetical protein